MKRIIAILLTAAMLVCVASCGEDKKTDAEKIVDDFNAELDDALKDLEDAVDDLDDALEDYDDDDDDFKATSSKFVVGEENGNVYTNAFSGIKFEKPADWTFATFEEKAELMDTGLELADRNEFEKKVAELTTVYDMVATSAEGDHVQVLYENLALLKAEDMTEEEYINSVVEGMKSVGLYDITTGEPTPATLDDALYTSVDIELVISGITQYQKLFVKKIGDYMCCVLITCQNAAYIEEVIDMFD